MLNTVIEKKRVDTDIKRVIELEDKSQKIREDLLNFIYQIGMGHLGGNSQL